MIELQRKLLGDKVRNDAFHAALQKVVTPESVVIDLGSGTGFLGFLASKLGAKHVVFIESGEIAKTGKKLARRNAIHKATFIHAHSTDVKDLAKADILISETLGNFALEENVIENIEDGKRFLKDKGIVIPGRISQFVCPVVSDRLAKDIDIWDVGFDLKFDEAREIAQNNMYVKTVRPDDLLKDGAKEWDTVDFSKKNTSVRTKTITWDIADTTVYGFALWWDAELVSGVHLSTSPLEAPTHWEQIFLPLLEPLKGMQAELTLTSDSRREVKINLSWTIRVLDAAGKEVSVQTMDMRKGYLA